MTKTLGNQKNLKKEVLQIEMQKLVPYEFNNKIHPKRQIDTIKNSILECGYIAEIIVDENNVILAGHGRYLALQDLGYETIQVQKVSGLSEVQKKKFRIMDNASAELAEYNIENIQFDLQEIGDQEFTALVCEIANIDIPDLDALGDGFSLPSDEKWNLTQMTFTVSNEQKEMIENAIAEIKKTDLYKSMMTYWNENSNGNALSCIIENYV